jgi:CRP/FNR family transcriptional regulator
MANPRVDPRCLTCPCGKAAGVAEGRVCPLVRRTRPRGTCVYLEGEEAERVWYVQRGTVVLSRSLRPDGTESPRAVRRAGSLIGLEALVRNTYLDRARVTSDAILCGATAEVMDAWLREAGPARMALDLMLQAEQADSPRRASSDGSATQRVVRWLLAEAEGGDTSVPRGTIAGLLGMTPETLSRTLTRLHRAGALVVTRRSVRIRDAALLRRLGEPASRERFAPVEG